MNKLNKIKEIIKANINNARFGIYFTRNYVGDTMHTLYEDGEVQVDICYDYEYFEVFGLTDAEQEIINQFYIEALVVRK